MTTKESQDATTRALFRAYGIPYRCPACKWKTSTTLRDAPRAMYCPVCRKRRPMDVAVAAKAWWAIKRTGVSRWGDRAALAMRRERPGAMKRSRPAPRRPAQPPTGRQPKRVR